MTVELGIKNEYFNTDHLRTGLKGKAMRGAGATIFASAFSFLVHFFGTIVLARLLVPADFGLIAMVTTFSLLIQNFGINGFTEAIIQREDVDQEMMSTLFWVNTAISAGLTIVFILMAPVIVWFYEEPRLYAVTICISFSIIVGGVPTLHMAILRRNMRFYVTSGIDIAAKTLSILFAIVLALLNYGYWALVSSMLVYPAVITFSAWIFCGWRPGRPNNWKAIQPTLKFAMHTYGNFTLNYFARNIDKLLIGWRYSAQPLGYYKKAYDLFALPASQLVVPLSNVALAALSRLANEPDKYRRYYLNAVSIIAFVGMPLSAVLSLAGNDIILLVLGRQWTKAGDIFCYFGASIGIMLIYGTQGWLHLSLGRPDRWFRWGVFEAVTTSLFFIIALPFGIAGVAIAYSVSFYILAGPCLLYAGRPIELRLSSIISVIWRYFLAALVAGLLSFTFLYKLDYTASPFAHAHIFVRIIISTLSCVILYLTATVFFYQSLSPIKQFISTACQMLPKTCGGDKQYPRSS